MIFYTNKIQQTSHVFAKLLFYLNILEKTYLNVDLSHMLLLYFIGKSNREIATKQAWGRFFIGKD